MNDDDIVGTMTAEPPTTVNGDRVQQSRKSSKVAKSSISAPISAPVDGSLETSEVEGDPVSLEAGSAGAAGLHDEVSAELGAESGEEFAEASYSQLAMGETGEESAVSDLESIEGFERVEMGEGESSESDLESLPDAGSALPGGGAEAEEEFLPFLAALVPTLASTVGPAIAKGVMSRLKPRTRKLIKYRLKQAKPGAASGKNKVLDTLLRVLASREHDPVNESAAEVDQALVEQAAVAMEVIIGKDDRLRITNTTAIPWRRICALRITFPSGKTYRGTGFFIGKRTLATAGHCVYLHAQGGWARSVEVIPGMNGSSRPYGSAFAVSLRSVGGWVNGKQPESDYGCVILPTNAFSGRSLGWFGLGVFSNVVLLAKTAVLAGYPGDKPFAELWGMARKIKAATPKTLVYDIDTMGGQSGSGVYIKHNGQRKVVGIHNYGALSGNSATRVTKPVFERLVAWSKI